MKDLEDDEREFPIRVYTKVELALLYAPHLSENAALNNLSRWMRHNKLLMAALEEVGYYKYRQGSSSDLSIYGRTGSIRCWKNNE